MPRKHKTTSIQLEDDRESELGIRRRRARDFPLDGEYEPLPFMSALGRLSMSVLNFDSAIQLSLQGYCMKSLIFKLCVRLDEEFKKLWVHKQSVNKRGKSYTLSQRLYSYT